MYILTGKVLLDSGEESLGEVKAGDPEVGGRPLVVPLLQELAATEQIREIRRQRLQRRVTLRT